MNDRGPHQFRPTLECVILLAARIRGELQAFQQLSLGRRPALCDYASPNPPMTSTAFESGNHVFARGGNETNNDSAAEGFCAQDDLRFYRCRNTIYIRPSRGEHAYVLRDNPTILDEKNFPAVGATRRIRNEAQKASTQNGLSSRAK